VVSPNTCATLKRDLSVRKGTFGSRQAPSKIHMIG